MFFHLLCITAFEQGHMEPWRYRNAFIIIINRDDLSEVNGSVETVILLEYEALKCPQLLPGFKSSKRVDLWATL